MSFNCSTTCVGIYADVQRVRKNFAEEMKGFVDLSEAKLNKEFDNDLQNNRFSVTLCTFYESVETVGRHD